MVARTVDDMKEHLTNKAVADEGFRQRLLGDPKAVISEEFGLNIPDTFSISVYEDTGTSFHLLLPASDTLTDEELAQVAGGLLPPGWGTF